LLPKFLIPKISNYIFVTSKPDKDYFIKKGFNSKKIIVITGGVDFNKYKDFSAPKEKEFDCIFYGRFHPQKGVIEIIDIWKILVTKLPKAKLVMIGDGPLFNDVKQKISEYGLDKNIFLKGHMDDSTEKLRIFGTSKIVVHPAVYDSGGMASAEVMYLKIPGISFDLDSLKTYYPKGMLKVEKFNFNKFSETILKLLNDKKLYDQLAIQAKECVLENFSWDKKAQELLDQVFDN
jgi:glycosyltransferase involved in cell wall biosynthesis